MMRAFRVLVHAAVLTTVAIGATAAQPRLTESGRTMLAKASSVGAYLGAYAGIMLGQAIGRAVGPRWLPVPLER